MTRIFAVVALSAGLPVHAQKENLEPVLGTWVRSMSDPAGRPQGAAATGEMTNKLDAVGNGFHFVEESSSGSFRIEYTVDSFDGKDYPWKGTTADGKVMDSADAIAFKKIDDYTYELEDKKAGKVIMKQKWVISKDGKTRTVFFSTKNGERSVTYEKKQ
jgi:hypothetical protein